MNSLISAAPAAASSAWTSADTNLVLCAVGGIGLVVLLTAVAKLHPFLALIAGTLLVAFSAGVPIAKILPTFETGVGGVLGGVGVIVALGAMLGRLLVDSGGPPQPAALGAVEHGARRDDHRHPDVLRSRPGTAGPDRVPGVAAHRRIDPARRHPGARRTLDPARP